MRPSVAVNDARQLIRELVHRFRVDNPHVFGSTAASLDHAGRDLDLLVDALPGATLSVWACSTKSLKPDSGCRWIW
jgi:predicted nucleotidyltransferase